MHFRVIISTGRKCFFTELYTRSYGPRLFDEATKFTIFPSRERDHSLQMKYELGEGGVVEWNITCWTFHLSRWLDYWVKRIAISKTLVNNFETCVWHYFDNNSNTLRIWSKLFFIRFIFTFTLMISYRFRR